jgi:hypothetical protein
MAKQDILQQAKENYADAQDFVREQNARFREDLRFSNPAAPEQWDAYAVKARKGRPMLTLDRTNQFISQIVNDARQNKPSIQVLPADSQADPDVAQRLNGIIRHIEYTSRAGIAYDCAIELSARVGQGWLRVLPKIVRPDTNEQEIIIQRVHDPMSICLDPNSVEPDGSDAMWGFAESVLTKKAFEKSYPKAKHASWDSDGWFSEDGVKIAEYFKVTEAKSNRLAIEGPDGGRMTVSEDEYWTLAQQIGFKPPVQDKFTAVKREVKWCKMTGAEILEETTFPSEWVPLIPVLGYELWVEGKRYLCGMVRRLMDGQRLHNYEMSALTETLMAQPKAPFIMSARAMDGHEDEWQALNQGNPAALTYNDVDDAGVPINAPTRLSPPLFPSAYASGAQLAVNEMEASVGMYKSNLGQQSNAVSGRAKLADQREGDTANFHYIDNLRRSMEHMGRIIVGMIPVVYDTRRQAKILGEDGEQSQVEIDPGMEQAVRKQGGKVVAINPSVGAYDVRVKIGPSYSSMRTEASQRLVEISQGNPALGAALAPLLVKLNDMPEADKISKVAIALLPPNVQAVYAEDEQDDIPPAVKMQLDSQKQQIEQLTATLQQAGAMVQDLQGQVEQKNTSAMDQAKVVKTQLDAQEADIRNQQQLLAKDVQIAKLQIQAQQREAGDALNQQQQDLDTRTAEVEAAEAPLMDQNAIKELAAAIDAQQQLLAHALAQNTQAVQQLQSITVTAFESIEDMADVIAAPRQINLKFDKSGKATGATSVLDMPQGVLPEAAGQ